MYLVSPVWHWLESLLGSIGLEAQTLTHMRLLSIIALLDRTLTGALQITQDTYFSVVWKNDLTDPVINENWWWRDMYLNLFFDDQLWANMIQGAEWL